MRKAWWAAGLLLFAGAAAVAQEQSKSHVGKEPPELQTKEWINSDGRTTLADFRGEVVLIEGWKTG
jgi:hypothetical protein